MNHYDTLFNNPYERNRITYTHVWWDNAFTNEELKAIQYICEKEELVDGVVVNDSAIDESMIEEQKKIRKSKVRFYSRSEDTDFIFKKFNYVAQALNNQYYGFDLNGYGVFQYTTYDAAYEGNYSWHMDIVMDGNLDSLEKNQTRKLTLILLLSEPGVDFLGGELQLNLGNEKYATTVDLPKGRIVAFPSWMIHQVKPVIAGVRKSIVVWIEGPKFI
jgi:PKHD-type hydroxylase